MLGNGMTYRMSCISNNSHPPEMLMPEPPLFHRHHDKRGSPIPNFLEEYRLGDVRLESLFCHLPPVFFGEPGDVWGLICFVHLLKEKPKDLPTMPEMVTEE